MHKIDLLLKKVTVVTVTKCSFSLPTIFDMKLPTYDEGQCTEIQIPSDFFQ